MFRLMLMVSIAGGFGLFGCVTDPNAGYDEDGCEPAKSYTISAGKKIIRHENFEIRFDKVREKTDFVVQTCPNLKVEKYRDWAGPTSETAIQHEIDRKEFPPLRLQLITPTKTSLEGDLCLLRDINSKQEEFRFNGRILPRNSLGPRCFRIPELAGELGLIQGAQASWLAKVWHHITHAVKHEVHRVEHDVTHPKDACKDVIEGLIKVGICGEVGAIATAAAECAEAAEEFALVICPGLAAVITIGCDKGLDASGIRREIDDKICSKVD